MHLFEQTLSPSNQCGVELKCMAWLLLYGDSRALNMGETGRRLHSYEVMIDPMIQVSGEGC
jgi:hypothetical protein